MSKITYNERSWAIDIISEIALFSSKVNKPIKRAGGESTINTGKKRFFPDVLLYGENSDILMGWELKMPDTAISDIDFIENAKIKAEILGLNSFLLWNAKEAILYLLENKNYIPHKSWDTSKGIIDKREDVENARDVWIESLHEILQDINNLFELGTIQRKPLIDSFSDTSIIKFILSNTKETAISLKSASRTDTRFKAEANVWWRIFKHNYLNGNQWEVLAEIVLINWIHKILFANILTAFQNDAKTVYNITTSTTPKEATQIFIDISSTCDFWNIFQPQLGEKYITSESWNNIVELNTLLRDIELASIGQELLQNILESVVSTSKRRVAGQFTTPIFLARLLVHFTFDNLTNTFHDPCCGTGTIARATYDIKKEAGISERDALASILASDKVAFPLQMATLAITEAKNMGEVIQIFQKDATDISLGEKIKLRNPYDGSIIEKEYKKVSSIASNLPFIQQEDLKVLNPKIKESTEKIIQKYLGKKAKLNAKSDMYAYLPFHFWELLEDNGRLGIIVSNSWLGTEWGTIFKDILSKFFHIEYIITSNSGRWFTNADVVTNILILEKKSVPQTPKKDDITKFVSISMELNNKRTNEEIEILYENILTDTDDGTFRIQEYRTSEIINIPLNWNALFGDISWLDEVDDKLIYANELFEINRGERRGWNDMFYPKKGHNIEPQYIKSVLKTPRHIKTLVAKADIDAFCCSKSIEELKKLKHNGALDWINKFEYVSNTKGKPLPKELKREGYFWYEMNDSTMADLVASMNFDKRIFIAKLETKSFVDQRLTRFTAKKEIDIDLIHALLNSILGIFFIESLGFGRGLGALDLSSTRIKKYLRVLNPELLTKEQIVLIKKKFILVRDREIKNITDEFKEADRIEFDKVVLEVFGILHLRDKIMDSFLYLYNMRTSVK
ncbi:Putative type IIS restriction /modification enzyme, N-terminal half [hydrothermal vent metagenome]|uniref:Putative type IIS restriction /modification enzyme, N-terminal half n=1 Tax=hydrothermal vent metagenome TaxID=652676 RepID=A0A1W1BAE1_9ZZZZ